MTDGFLQLISRTTGLFFTHVRRLNQNQPTWRYWGIHRVRARYHVIPLRYRCSIAITWATFKRLDVEGGGGRNWTGWYATHLQTTRSCWMADKRPATVFRADITFVIVLMELKYVHSCSFRSSGSKDGRIRGVVRSSNLIHRCISQITPIPNRSSVHHLCYTFVKIKKGAAFTSLFVSFLSGKRRTMNICTNNGDQKWYRKFNDKIK